MTKRGVKYSLIAASLALAGVVAVYVAVGIAPFGDRTVVTGDLGGMYLPFYAHVAESLGDGFSWFSFQKALGGGVQGLIAYIPAALYMLLTPLFGPGGLPAFFAMLFAAKLSLAAGAFCLFAGCRTRPAAVNIALGLCYAFMGYSFIYAQNTMWLDNVVLLPLLLLALDRLVDKGRSFWFMLVLTLAILSNYYTAFMLCIFCCLYLLWRLFGEGRPQKKQAFVAVGRFALSGVLAAATTAALMLPMAFQTLESKGFSSAEGGFFAFPVRQMGRQLVLFSFSFDQLENGPPIIYCGLLAVAGAALYFVSKNIGRRQKLLSAAFVGILLASFIVAPLNRVWHIFRDPVWFPFRYSFLFAALLLILSADAFAQAEVDRRTALKWAGAFAGVMLLAVGSQLGVLSWKMLLLTLAAAGVVFLASAYAASGRGRGQLSVLLLAGIVFLEMVSGGAYTTSQFELKSDLDMESYSDDIRALLEKTDNDEFYRLEKDSFQSLNDPMLFGYNGLNHFSSVADDASFETLARLGYSSVYKNPTHSTLAANSLLNIRYIISDGSFDLADPYVEIGDAGGQTLYENPYALPFAFFAADVGDVAGKNSFEYLNAVYSAIAGEELALFSEVFPEIEGDNYRFGELSDGLYYTSFLSKNDGSSVSVDGQTLGEAGFYAEEGIAALGALGDGAVNLSGYDARFYRFDLELFADIVGDIREAAPADIIVEEGHIKIVAVPDAPGTLMLSMPFYDDWQLTVNGEAAELIPAFSSFAAIRLPAGESRIALRYRPKGRSLGVGISVVALFAAAALVLFEARRKPKGGDPQP